MKRLKLVQLNNNFISNLIGNLIGSLIGRPVSFVFISVLALQFTACGFSIKKDEGKAEGNITVTNAPEEKENKPTETIVPKKDNAVIMIKTANGNSKAFAAKGSEHDQTNGTKLVVDSNAKEQEAALVQSFAKFNQQLVNTGAIERLSQLFKMDDKETPQEIQDRENRIAALSEEDLLLLNRLKSKCNLVPYKSENPFDFSKIGVSQNYQDSRKIYGDQCAINSTEEITTEITMVSPTIKKIIANRKKNLMITDLELAKKFGWTQSYIEMNTNKDATIDERDEAAPSQSNINSKGLAVLTDIEGNRIEVRFEIKSKLKEQIETAENGQKVYTALEDVSDTTFVAETADIRYEVKVNSAYSKDSEQAKPTKTTVNGIGIENLKYLFWFAEIL
jgi:hypothetical protein